MQRRSADPRSAFIAISSRPMVVRFAELSALLERYKDNRGKNREPQNDYLLAAWIIFTTIKVMWISEAAKQAEAEAKAHPSPTPAIEWLYDLAEKK